MRQHDQAISEAKAILKEYNIKATFSYKSNQCFSRISEAYIHIGLNSPEFKDKAAVMSAVFHEIAHIVNFRNKKFFAYHNDKVTTQATYDYAVRFGLRAEQHTDFIGAKMMKAHYPKLRFRFTYNRKVMKQRYRDEFLPLLQSFIG
jgi:hypothetical protein